MRKAIAFDSTTNRRLDSAGFLHVDNCCITKAEVTEYVGHELPGWRELKLQGDRIYKVYRPLSVIEAGLSSLNNLPLIAEHQSITADNFDESKPNVVGSTGQVAYIKDGKAFNTLAVYEGETIGKIQRGKIKGISLGYYFSVKVENGEFEGDQYEIVITTLSGQHLALTNIPRVKEAVIADNAKELNIFKGGKRMKKQHKKQMLNKLLTQLGLALDETPKEGESCDDVAQLIEAVKAHLDGMEDEAKNAVSALIEALAAAEGEDEDEAKKKEGEDEAEIQARKDEAAGAAESDLKRGDKPREKTDAQKREGEDEDDVMISEDSLKNVIDAISARVLKNVTAQSRQLGQAYDDARNLLGDIDISKLGTTAEQVNEKVLTALGMDSKAYVSAAEKHGAIKALIAQGVKPAAKKSIAFDDATKVALAENPTLKRIQGVKRR